LLPPAPHGGARLREPVESSAQVGTLAPYFVHRFGFSAGTKVIAFTGDNPSSLVGMGATEPGTAVVSLGTSDTVFAAMSAPRTDPRGFGHVFGNPAGGFMCLICFANGSLARERVAERVGLDWPAFERAVLEQTVPGNGGALLLPYFVPEITPKLLNPEPRLFGDATFTSYSDAARVARAIVEAQALGMQRYSDFIGERPTRILATGGAAKNVGILQIIADVFQAEVRTLKVANSAALGAALSAAHGAAGLEWRELFARFAAPDPKLVCRPNPKADYADLRTHFAREVDRLVAEN
jgi:xylulokinase